MSRMKEERSQKQPDDSERQYVGKWVYLDAVHNIVGSGDAPLTVEGLAKIGARTNDYVSKHGILV